MNAAERRPDLSVVIPVYNEATNIRPLASEVFDALAGRVHYELLFVDDGSIDDTADEIARAMAGNGAISTCRHASNRGQSAAVRTGVLAARADVVAVLDGDGQNDPQDILPLYGRLMTVKSLSMVIGERKVRRDAWLRRASSKLANAIRSRVLADGSRDTGCGLKVFHKERYLALPAFDHMHRFLPALVQMNGGRVSAVPVNHRERLSGCSKYGVNNRLWVGIVDLLGVMWLQKRRL